MDCSGTKSSAEENTATNAVSSWISALPDPKTNSPPTITCSEVLQLLDQGNNVRKDFVLIDLRREDREGGTIQGSLNLPAQSLYSSISTLHDLFSRAGIKRVIFYCGSSLHRGARAAGWFADFINETGDTHMQSYVLLGGINGWARAGSKYVQKMDEYREDHWRE